MPSLWRSYPPRCRISLWQCDLVVYASWGDGEKIPENNSQPGVLWCCVGHAELLHWYNGKCPCWTPSLSADCKTKIKFPPSENWNSIVFFFGHCCYWVSAQSWNTMQCPPHPKTPVHWAMLHTRTSLSKCYAHIVKKVVTYWWVSIVSTWKFGRNHLQCWILTPKECC